VTREAAEVLERELNARAPEGVRYEVGHAEQKGQLWSVGPFFVRRVTGRAAADPHSRPSTT
jgi:hypothetical protein